MKKNSWYYFWSQNIDKFRSLWFIQEIVNQLKSELLFNIFIKLVVNRKKQLVLDFVLRTGLT